MYHWEVRFLPSASLRFRRNDGGRGPAFYNLRPLKGKRLTTFCASLALLHPLLSLTHWIFGSLMLPYKSSSLVQNVFAVHRFARGGPPIGGQDNDGVSLLCSDPYTLLPLRGISPQGETRNLRRKTESHILHVPLRHSPPLVAVATTLPGGKHVI